MKVKVYSTPTCPYCVMAKRYFDDIGVKYEEVDVSHDQKEAEIMQQKSGQLGVPVLIFSLPGDKEEVVIGFDKDQIDKIIGINQSPDKKA